jgi:hypothetical protein
VKVLTITLQDLYRSFAEVFPGEDSKDVQIKWSVLMGEVVNQPSTKWSEKVSQRRK